MGRGKRKQFDRELFRQNDARAVAAVVGYICREGGFATQNPELYEPDIIVYGSGFRKLAYIETEVKHGWQGTGGQGPDGLVEFPFPTVNLPERKGQYLSKRLEVEYWILRSDLLAAVVIPGSVLDEKQLAEVSNKYIKEGEVFYQVPLELCNLVDLSEISREEQYDYV